MSVRKDRDRAARRRARARRNRARERRRPFGRRGQARRVAQGARFYVHLLVPLGMILVLLVAGGFSGVRLIQAHYSARADEQRREAVLSAARQQALNFTTIGYKSVDTDIDRVVRGATGDFKASYKRNRKTIEQTVTKNKSTSKGQVLSAGVKSLDADSAVALVVVDASVTNVAHEKPTLQNYRMQFDLARVKGDKWLVSGVEFVG